VNNAVTKLSNGWDVVPAVENGILLKGRKFLPTANVTQKLKQEIMLSPSIALDSM